MNTRLKQLEDRNNLLFKAIGSIDFWLDENPDKVYTVQQVKDLLESIASGKELKALQD